MLKPEFTGQFKRDYKLAVKRGCNPKKLEEVIFGIKIRSSKVIGRVYAYNIP